ncbi:L,D-transpeptidase family protein [Schnuerera sp.]|uniref:L,D-transpeptidase family protein n=1 Tax=Schnuerera sp. TaxID=2794844 RepID=UPI002C974719|nr:L,D-transpeptidase family protein [Schnuerera sp.]HSH36093.1 L,D-transpeptidase family protein [Schnuerera sp.]
MSKRIKIILLLFILILIVIIIGNYIHLFLIKRDIGYENKDTYFKIDKKNLAILIEVDRKQLSVIDLSSNKIINNYVIATGKANTPTPLGTFKIIEKAKWGGGFGSRWLGLDVPWGKYGIHGTNKPGSIGFNASAGCIRMRNKDVEELYNTIDYNTTVAITNGDYGPFAYGLKDLKPGDSGADVMEVQKRLKIRGYYTGALDGIYGEGMKYSLIQFLKDNNISLTDTVGYEIYEKLNIILMD